MNNTDEVVIVGENGVLAIDYVYTDCERAIEHATKLSKKHKVTLTICKLVPEMVIKP